ncbi:hypothetical protein COJ23_22255 [Priestia megaterium]|nr:hypothetical protein COJ23_22255 [Priestia megaterium]
MSKTPTIKTKETITVSKNTLKALLLTLGHSFSCEVTILGKRNDIPLDKERLFVYDRKKGSKQEVVFSTFLKGKVSMW